MASHCRWPLFFSLAAGPTTAARPAQQQGQRTSASSTKRRWCDSWPHRRCWPPPPEWWLLSLREAQGPWPPPASPKDPSLGCGSPLATICTTVCQPVIPHAEVCQPYRSTSCAASVERGRCPSFRSCRICMRCGRAPDQQFWKGSQGQAEGCEGLHHGGMVALMATEGHGSRRPPAAYSAPFMGLPPAAPSFLFTWSANGVPEAAWALTALRWAAPGMLPATAGQQGGS